MAAVQLLAVTARSPDRLVVLKSTTASASWRAVPMTLEARRVSVSTFADRDQCDNLSWNSDRSILAIAGTSNLVRFVSVTAVSGDVLRTTGGTTITLNAGAQVISVAWHPRLDRLYVGLNAAPFLKAFTYNRISRTFTAAGVAGVGTLPSSAVKTISFTRSGSHMAVRDKGVYAISSTGTGTFQSGSPDGGVGALSISPDGVYAASDDRIYEFVDGSWSEQYNLGLAATIQRSAWNLSSSQVLLSATTINYVYNDTGGLLQTINPSNTYSDIAWESTGLGFLIGRSNSGTLHRFTTTGGSYTGSNFNIPELVLVNTAGTSDIQLAPSIHSVVFGKYVEPGYGEAGYFGDGSIVGLNSFSVSGTLAELGEVTMVTTSTVSVSAERTRAAVATVTVQSAVSVAGNVEFSAVSSLNSTVTVVTAAEITRGGSAALVVDSTVAALSGLLQSAQCSTVSDFQVTAAAVAQRQAQGNFSSVSTVLCQATAFYDDSLAISVAFVVPPTLGQVLFEAQASLSGAAEFLLSAEVLVLQDALLAVTTQLTADGDVTLGAAAALESVATLAAEARFPVNHEAQADLLLTATQTTLGGRLIQPNEVRDYSWDELPSWTEWPHAEWEPRGVFMQVSGFQIILGGITPSGQALLETSASLSALGGYLLQDTPSLVSESTLTSQSQVTRPAGAALSTQAQLTAAGQRTQDIDLGLFNSATVTASAVLITQGLITIQSQAQVEAVPSRVAGGSMAVSSQAILLSQGHYLRLASANLEALYAVLSVSTIFKVDGYRLIQVSEETRVLAVQEESRRARTTPELRQVLVEGHTE